MKSQIKRLLESDLVVLLLMAIIIIPFAISYSKARERLERNIGSEIIRGKDTLYITGFSVPGKYYTLSNGTEERSYVIDKLIKKDKWRE
jgi:hypothetical protein